MWLNKFGIIYIIFLAGILRLISLNQSLWWDEAINVVYARQNDFLWFISKYPLGDFHPPGWFIILWVWGHLFGWSEISVRMPSVILGVGTVYLTYLIGTKFFSKKIGLLASLMLSIAPLHIYYSQEARMYSFSAFAVTFSVYSFIKLIKKERFSWLIYALSSVIVLYSDYVAYFIFPVQLIYLLIFEKRIIKIYLKAFILSFVFYIPWIFILPSQIMNGQKTAISIPGWREIVGSSSIKELLLLPVKILVGRISFEDKLLYFGFVLSGTVPFIIVFSKIKKVFDKKYYLILMWLIIPPISVWLFSYLLPIFSYFRLLFILPAFYMAVAGCLCKFSDRIFRILIFLILIFELIATFSYLFNNNFQREDWRGAVQFIDKVIDKKSLVLLKSNDVVAPFIYYNNQSVDVSPIFKVIPVKDNTDIQDLGKVISNKNEIYVFEYLSAVTDPNNLSDKEFENLHFKKVEIRNFTGVGFITVYKIL